MSINMESSKSVDRSDARPSDPPTDSHETLKYQLLGPSLTKAGQSSVDQQKVSEIIYNASKGSKFFTHEQSRDQILTAKIERILAQKKKLEAHDLSAQIRRVDEYLAELELGRDLSQTVVHIDCDAFFAAVEELDRPELRDLPMAVGKGVLTTCNYHARKYGCRSGMASFIAKKLCPDLILLPQNYEKYTAKAEEIRAILALYDPQFQSASIDEAYLNITDYCSANELNPEDAVQKLRNEVLEQTKVTVSAGIAPNARIAKICSNWNKPNGQYYVPNDRSAVMSFMSDIPLRKVNGVGRVFERELDAIGIKHCRDIFIHRGVLCHLFGQKAYKFLMQCYLGLGRTRIEPAEASERKSVGTERTFGDLAGMANLQERLRATAVDLEKDMIRTGYKGRTLVLKVKLHTFEVLSRQVVPPRAIYLSEDLYRYSLPMLMKLQKENPDMKLRLMGLRCTNLVSTKKPDINFFGTANRGGHTCSTSEPLEHEKTPPDEQEFELPDRSETLEEAEALESAIRERETLQGPFNNTGDPISQPTSDLEQPLEIITHSSSNLRSTTIACRLRLHRFPTRPVTFWLRPSWSPPSSEPYDVIMRDQLLRPQSSNQFFTAKMAPEKHPNGQPTKPFTPTMSSVFRPTKNPLTPKLAGYTPTHTPHKAVYTESGPRNGQSRPEGSTAPTVLSTNITPRSGPRISRRDGNSSPADTPTTSQCAPRLGTNPTTHGPTNEVISRHDGNTASGPRVARAKSVVNDNQLLTATSRTPSSCGSSAGSPKFFHASYNTDSRSLPKQTPSTTFLYADGTTSEDSHREGLRGVASLDRTPRLKSPELVSSRSKQPYTLSTLSRDSPVARHDQTPTSPHLSTPPSQSATRDYHTARPHDSPPLLVDSSKRSSHTKSSSMDASQYSKRRKQDLLPNATVQPSFPSAEAQSLIGTGTPDLSPRVVSVGSTASTDHPLRSQSPTKEEAPHNSEVDKMNELAANARRERKVLDLEISNSSLLAINRTLEREMRKQSAELRRFRRLSRSGRLSMTDSFRAASGGTLSIVSETEDARSETSFGDSNEELSDPSDDESTLSDGHTSTPDSIAGEDPKHQTRDEKRFMIDLAKHQQLLVDSQKLNQTIKRCLGWTESLIQEGKKALEYHVHVSDVDIGGRVLAPDEIDGVETEGRRALLSPTIGVAELFTPPIEEGPIATGVTLHD
ncbi:hypothetical protein FQN55_005151 [Onygenales sp. PD_40]|nr:hypothetical protein FQN55_005151 [Onygenales sp. PD_40]